MNEPPSHLTQQAQKPHQPKKVVNIDEEDHHLQEESDGGGGPGPSDTLRRPQDLNDERDEGAAANEIAGFQDNLTGRALDQLDNELSHSLIMNAEELRTLQAQTLLATQG